MSPGLGSAGPSVRTNWRSYPATHCHYADFSFFLPFSERPISMSSSSILSQHFYHFHLFSLSPSKLFFSCTFTNLIIFLEPPSACLSCPFSPSLSYPSYLSQVHCSGHASSLPTRHGTKLLSACGPHDYGRLGTGLCCVLPAALRL